jgi:uncharacterized protein with HEPN domain
MSDKNALIFIEHIRENIDAIEDFSRSISKEDLLADKQKQYAIIRAIEIIGESVKNLPDSFIKKYPKTSWKEIVGTRDKLIHHYFGIDPDMIWKIIKEDIPKLKEQIQELLKKEK